MRHTVHTIAFAIMLVLAACASRSEPGYDSEGIALDDQLQPLSEDFCDNHPVICEHFEQFCADHPVMCGTLCLEHPQVPFCQGGGDQCREVGQTCVGDEEDPNYVPCCGFEEGLADCFLDFETGQRTCQAIEQCDGPSINQECLPEGPACCPDHNGGVVNCEATDPSDPNTSYICTPAP